MKAAVIASSLVLSAVAAEPNYEALWTGFKNRYNRQFPTNSVEEVTRFGLFKAKVDEIIAINKVHDSFTVGINEFADLTPEEFKNMYLGYKPELRKKDALKSTPWKPVDASLVADSIDWVSKGAVTPVKNQGQCGSCWAFSTTGGVEGAYAVASGNLVSLSEQQLVSCDTTDSGCQGGLMDYGFEFIQKNGVATEQNYPYTSGGGVRGSCQSGHPAVVTVTGYTDVPSMNEDSLQQAVSQHPVSVAIEADKTVFQSYTSGILDSSACGTQLDHGVLAVGYGTDNGVAYWKVKNSWGTSWGDNGYLLMAKGKNMCGISQEPSYPTGAKAASLAEPNYEALWTGFKNKYNKKYNANGVEEATRFSTFKAKVDEIIAINKAHDSFTVGINEFADLTPQEFKSMYLGFKPELRKQDALKSTPWKPVDASLVADSIDWVSKGAVTPVKNQGQCGSCWAFSTTGGVEGAYAVASGNLVSLSEQQLVSCDTTDSGCQGGLMDYGFEYIQKNGVATEQNYPYTSGGGVRGSCQSGHPAVVTVTGYTDVPSMNEDSLQQAVSQHPVSVAIEADKTVFQSYTSGILDSTSCGTQLDHGVLAVGYGTDNGVAYWKVKNSWGTSWGDNGYLLMAKGKNMCGISQEPSYPTGAKAAAVVV